MPEKSLLRRGRKNRGCIKNGKQTDGAHLGEGFDQLICFFLVLHPIWAGWGKGKKCLWLSSGLGEECYSPLEDISRQWKEFQRKGHSKSKDCCLPSLEWTHLCESCPVLEMPMDEMGNGLGKHNTEQGRGWGRRDCSRGWNQVEVPSNPSHSIIPCLLPWCLLK